MEPPGALLPCSETESREQQSSNCLEMLVTEDELRLGLRKPLRLSLHRCCWSSLPTPASSINSCRATEPTSQLLGVYSVSDLRSQGKGCRFLLMPIRLGCKGLTDDCFNGTTCNTTTPRLFETSSSPSAWGCVPGHCFAISTHSLSMHCAPHSPS